MLFRSDGLLDHVLALVVCEDKVSFKNGCMEMYSQHSHSQAFQLVDKPEFRQLLQYQHPETKENVIPHRTKCQVILKAAYLLRNVMPSTWQLKGLGKFLSWRDTLLEHV